MNLVKEGEGAPVSRQKESFKSKSGAIEKKGKDVHSEKNDSVEKRGSVVLTGMDGRRKPRGETTIGERGEEQHQGEENAGYSQSLQVWEERQYVSFVITKERGERYAGGCLQDLDLLTGIVTSRRRR